VMTLAPRWSESSGETPIQHWRRTHPGVDLERWVVAWSALDSIQSDWEYRNGALALPEKYTGQRGWWL